MARDASPEVKEEEDDTKIDAYFHPDNVRAYFVVLNRADSVPSPGVFTERYVLCVALHSSHHNVLARPPNTALGKHISLLPIVVICSTKSEAWTIYQLNEEVVNGLQDPTDAQEFRRAIVRSAFVRNMLMQETCTPYYALKVAQETGIYHGFDWYDS